MSYKRLFTGKAKGEILPLFSVVVVVVVGFVFAVLILLNTLPFFHTFFVNYLPSWNW